jgi:hypothetical protein
MARPALIVQFIRLLTICPGCHYTDRLHPVSIALVFSMALLWSVFSVLMLARLNGAGTGR